MPEEIKQKQLARLDKMLEQIKEQRNKFIDKSLDLYNKTLERFYQKKLVNQEGYDIIKDNIEYLIINLE